VSQLEFYRTRAAEARRDAEAATLANVRDRCLRAQAAWTGMADRAERGERMRAQIEARKQAERAAARLEACGGPEAIKAF
jgi:hypothetical protein